tara:strand:+ start:351 stop:629 length:279 start_codon:yes stop_codon:yes gene_type:complete
LQSLYFGLTGLIELRVSWQSLTKLGIDLENNMKNLVLATVFAAAAATAFADGMSEPVMDAPVVASTMESAAGSSNGLLVPLVLLALLAMVSK